MLHAFVGADGRDPDSPVLLDRAGNIFGTARLGGSGGWGVAFRLSPAGKETILHNFTGGKDGGEPLAGLIRDPSGNLYGTTYGGGIGCQVFTCGVVFELNLKGKETVLHDFDGTGGGCTFAGVVRDAAGDLYGTTGNSGRYTNGVLFEIQR